MRISTLLLLLLGSSLASPAAESWSDPALPVKEGLALWLDSTREKAARQVSGRGAPRNGAPLDLWHDASGQRRNVYQTLPERRPRYADGADGHWVAFDGTDDFLQALNAGSSFENGTVFIVGSATSNAGKFRGFMALNATGRNDYTAGLNIDLGPFNSTRFAFLNVEGSGIPGAFNFLNEPFPFGTVHVFALAVAAGEGTTKLWVDGQPHGIRSRGVARIGMDEITVGARFYSNTAEPPHTQGYLEGRIAEVLIYNRALTDEQRKAVEAYLVTKHAAFLASAPAESALKSQLIPVANPPPVQMFVPGFATREMPIRLKNINNLRYRRDGKLVALAYDGSIHLLTDSDGDGLEDTSKEFFPSGKLNAPIGMALTHSDSPQGEGVVVAAKGRVLFIADTDGDDVADKETIVATGWKELPHGVDALGVAVDDKGAVYFGLGTANFTDAYLLDQSGRARYSLDDERGTILRVSPDFKKREILCTGIRFPVGLAFNRAGDLFCTDQEGATWLPNGNPFDELLHIQKDRHYGFPPRHPKHLPGVIDEPSVFDYTPQHQSTCGFIFNECVNDGPVFGPDWWEGDALVTGYSRGKLYRTSLVKTGAGYVARNQLIAALTMMPSDVCLSPGGDLVVAAHSGLPDWGSGPQGEGKLFKISLTEKDLPQPRLVWAASPTETRVAFDRPVQPGYLRDLLARSTLVRGKYVGAGDRFESLRPGYQVVQDQMVERRDELPILSASVLSDGQTLSLRMPAQTAALNYGLSFPVDHPSPKSRYLRQEPVVDLAYDLTGVALDWNDSNGKSHASWLPAMDSAVARHLTRGSPEHDAFWDAQPTAAVIRGKFDLANMLLPPVQPGSSLDYEPPQEHVFLEFRALAPFQLNVENQTGEAMKVGASFTRIYEVRPQADQLLPFTIELQAQGTTLEWSVRWWTSLDSTPRAMPLRRVLVPWAEAPGKSVDHSKRPVPEIAGGDWMEGKRIFFQEQTACYRCHTIRGEGRSVGPDLSNLVHRDYASVLRDITQPNAAINPDHVAYEVETTSGEVYSGVLRKDGADEVVLADALGRLVRVPREEVEEMRALRLSLMPEGMGELLAPGDLKNLMTFLLTVPLEPVPHEIEGAPEPRSMTEFRKLFPNLSDVIESKKPLHILLAAGPKDHGPGEHDYPLWQKRWKTLLSLDPNATLDTALGWPKPEQFKNADVIVFYSNNPGWNAERASELDAFLERGGGLVYIHYAVDGHQHVDELSERIGLAWRGGGSKFRHGPLDLRFHQHALVEGFDALHLIDESYWQLVGNRSEIQLVASGMEEGSPQPLIWTREQGKGRVFVSIPGHYTWTFDDPIFRALILRGIAWAAQEPLDRFLPLAVIGANLKQ